MTERRWIGNPANNSEQEMMGGDDPNNNDAGWRKSHFLKRNYALFGGLADKEKAQIDVAEYIKVAKRRPENKCKRRVLKVKQPGVKWRHNDGGLEVTTLMQIRPIIASKRWWEATIQIIMVLAEEKVVSWSGWLSQAIYKMMPCLVE